jgi:hypothetical protein
MADIPEIAHCQLALRYPRRSATYEADGLATELTRRSIKDLAPPTISCFLSHTFVRRRKPMALSFGQPENFQVCLSLRVRPTLLGMRRPQFC